MLSCSNFRFRLNAENFFVSVAGKLLGLCNGCMHDARVTTAILFARKLEPSITVLLHSVEAPNCTVYTRITRSKHDVQTLLAGMYVNQSRAHELSFQQTACMQQTLAPVL